MAAAKARTVPVNRLIGPYEEWTFGLIGSKYASGNTPLAGPTQLTALAELPRGHALQQSRKKIPLISGEVAHTPTMWMPVFQTNPAPAAHFNPLVLELTIAPITATGRLAGIQGALSSLTSGAAAPAGRGGGGPPPPPPLPPNIGYRLNSPLPTGSFDPTFTTSVAEPVYTVDANLQNKVDAQPAGRPTLAIVAVIDDGLAFAHRNLLDSRNGARMDFCWLQSAVIATDPAKRTVLFGREHTRDDINDLLRDFGHDEDTLYRAAGSIRTHSSTAQPMAGLLSHGSLVTDIAAGHRHGQAGRGRPVVDPDLDMDRVRLIGVELPTPAIMDTVGFGKDAYILSAFHYIFERADRLEAAYECENLPLVINFSFGFTGGAHNGTDRLEAAISAMISARNALGKPTRLVMPAGNHFLGAMHGQINRHNLDPKNVFSVPWRIQPNDKTASYFEAWYPQDEQGKPGAEPGAPAITAPSGAAIALGAPKSSINPPQTIWNMMFRGEVVGQLSVDLFRGSQWRMMVVLAPSEPRGLFPAAPAGLWQITVDAARIKGSNSVISCRIQRDTATVHPALGGRQSYFDHPRDRLYSANGTASQSDAGAHFVRRFGTLNGLATHGSVIVAGGFIENTGRASEYSSAGDSATVTGAAGAVFCSAPSDESPVVRGQRAAGTRSGSSARLIGTSAAAPHISRGIALAFLGNPSIAIAAPAGATTDISGMALLANAPIKLPDFDPAGTSPDRLGSGKITL